MDKANGVDVEERALLNGDEGLDQIDPRITERFSKVNVIRRWITVEPVMFLYFMAFIPLIPLGEQYVLAQVAQRRNVTPVSKDGSVSSCISNQTQNASDLEKEIQAEASHWLILFNACALVPGILVTVLIGSYSDHMGRKVGLLTPIIGNFFRCGISAIIIAFDLPFELFTIGLLIDGFTGTVASVIAAGFSTLSDITTHKQRALRIMFVEISLGIGLIVGQFGTGLLLQKIGFEYTFAICGLIQIINGFYVMFVFIETRMVSQDVKFFTTEHYVRIWKLLSKSDDDGRWKKLAPLVFLFIYGCVETGSLDNITYFQMAQPLCFTSVLIGFWQALSYAVRFTAGLATVKLLTDRVGDADILCLGFVSGILFYTLVGFTSRVDTMFLVVMAGAWFSLVPPLVRTIVSKIVSTEEQGVVYSAVATMQALSMLLGSASFNAIYAATLTIHRGMVFFIQAGILLCTLGPVLYFVIKLKLEKKYPKQISVAEES